MIETRSETAKLLAEHASYQCACTLELHERARAHWPNVAQIDLTVVVVIVAVVVVAVAEILLFLKKCDRQKHTQTHRQTGVVIDFLLN